MKRERKPMINLKIMRIRRGMTQVELAAKVGISQNALSFYEVGSRSPRMDILYKLADALDCEIKDIV